MVAEKMYMELMKQIPNKNEKFKNMRTWIAKKYALFQFKINYLLKCDDNTFVEFLKLFNISDKQTMT